MLTFTKKMWGLFAVCTLLAACSAPVKLDEPKVEDLKPVAVAPLQQPARDTRAPTPPAADASGSSRIVPQVRTEPVQQAAERPRGVNGTVYFDYNSFVVRSEFQGALEGHAKFLTANRDRKIALEGHTDERGGREYNLALGQKRAEAVSQALRLLGVGDAQVEAVSFGKEKPAAAGSDEAAWAKNRRAEVFYR